MSFFRRPLDITNATVRAASERDITEVSRVLRDGSYRFFNAPGSDLPALLASHQAVVLTIGAQVVAAAVADWPIEQVCWLRGLMFAQGIALSDGLDALLPAFHDMLRERGLRQIFYAGDMSADSWAQPGLLRRGYARETDVIVYENRRLDIPSTGKQDVTIRHAEPVDLPAIMAVDQAAFAPQWVKDEGVLSPAIADMSFFIVAELHGAIVGYAFATAHFNGRLVHLVRIAVHPAQHGHGIGIRLLAQVVAYARTSGAESLTLNTQLENTQAQRLYEWFGFRRTGERQRVLRYDLVR
jgi:ribosomal protein S18 acetylase RimI-like enzyme